MPRPLSVIAGALGGFALYRLLTSRRRTAPYAPPQPGPDPRADELRRKLAESRSVVDEREQVEAAETPVEQADAVADKRRKIHERGHSVAEEMRDTEPDEPAQSETQNQ